MSKNIWHKAGFHEAIDDKLKVSKDGKWVYWTMYGWNIAGEDAHDIGCEWAYLDDLLALETELILTRKVLDVARNGLSYIFGYEGVPEYVARHVRQVLDQIRNETALEQKD